VIQSVERPMGTQLLPPPITGNMIMDSEFMITNAIKNDQYGLPSAGIHTHTHTHIQNSCTLVGEEVSLLLPSNRRYTILIIVTVCEH